MASKSNLEGRREGTAQSTQRLLSALHPSREGSDQRRWSADLNTPAVITVKKKKKEPKPPQRSVSLQRPHPAEHFSSKRNSCPAFEILSQPHSSSPSAVQTSAITGPDPSGWKIHPKSASSQAHAARLSLQIPILDIFPEVQSLNLNNPPETNAPKPSCWHYSGSLGTRLPDTSEELHAVFCDGDLEKHEKPTEKPPPVPVKTEMARQIAQLIAFSQELPIGTPSSRDQLI